MLMVRGAPMGFAGVPFLPVKFNFFAPIGEAFWVPYFHKDVGPSWSVLFEAKAGGAMDRFGGAQTGDEALAIAKQVIRDLMPWDYAWAKDMELLRCTRMARRAGHADDSPAGGSAPVGAHRHLRWRRSDVPRSHRRARCQQRHPDGEKSRRPYHRAR